MTEARPPFAAGGMAMRARTAGFTLMEITIVLVIVGIVAALAFTRNSSPAAYTLLSQGEVLAANLRHTQTLATTWSRSLSVGLAGGVNGTYSVSCVTASAAAPCNSSPVIDPATGSGFSVSAENGVTLCGPAALSFDSSGKPAASAAYHLSLVDDCDPLHLPPPSPGVTVTVAATTGFVTVSSY